ncbi:MAG: biotin transporter BioY [Treponema sp.]|nr:biotin transporter BioY [Treponema sp.]
MKNKAILYTSFLALFAAIICVGSFMRIPLGPVPIVLQNALAILTGALLGGALGGAPTAIFLLAGLIGLPVYSGGTSGPAVWAGPTGGFLPGYLLGAILAGFISGRPSISEKKLSWKTTIRVSLGILAGMVILYLPGLIHFARWAAGAGKVPAEKSLLAYTMGACLIPYIPGDLLKIVVAIPVALKVRPILAQYLYSDKNSKSDKVEKEEKAEKAENQVEE